jgi:hypothetical protein
MCCKRKCLRPRSYRNRFNGVQNGITHFPFDVEEAKIVKAELGDNATILVMGLVQDEDMEW